MEELDLRPISSLFEEDEETEVTEPTEVEVEEVEEKDVVEVEEEIENEDDISLDNAKTYYNRLKEIGLPVDDLDENQEITFEFLQEQEKALPEKLFLNYVETRPDFIQDLLEYQASLDNPKVEDLRDFWNKYIDVPQEHDIETNEGAREYLKSLPEFVKFYKTPEKIEQALDLLDDDGELLERAKELKAEEMKAKEVEKAEALKKANEAKQQKLENEKRFAGEIQKVASELKWEDAKKKKALTEINPNNISQKWQAISSKPKALVQFGDLFSYFDGESFDALYDILEGKKNSQENRTKKTNIEKDSLGRLLGNSKPSESKFRSLIEDFG